MVQLTPWLGPRPVRLNNFQTPWWGVDGMTESCADQHQTAFDDAVSEPKSQSRWLVAMTRPHKESLALERLGQQNFETYCPLVNKRVRHARRAFDARRPLFPSYVFILYRPELRWQAIRSTIGVRSIVGRGDEPSLLDGRFVEALRAREVDGVVASPSTPFEVGQKVSITRGAFADIVAEIVELRDERRVLLLLDLLGGKVKTMVSSDAIQAR